MVIDGSIRDFHRNLSDLSVILLVLARPHRIVVLRDVHIEQ
jgi:hypothetical protein